MKIKYSKMVSSHCSKTMVVGVLAMLNIALGVNVCESGACNGLPSPSRYTATLSPLFPG